VKIIPNISWRSLVFFIVQNICKTKLMMSGIQLQLYPVWEAFVICHCLKAHCSLHMDEQWRTLRSIFCPTMRPCGKANKFPFFSRLEGLFTFGFLFISETKLYLTTCWREEENELADSTTCAQRLLPLCQHYSKNNPYFFSFFLFILTVMGYLTIFFWDRYLKELKK